MKKILILYATREGQTQKVAERLALHLVQAGVQVELINAQEKASTQGIDLNRFDLLVFGASMHAGGLEPEMVTFINHHRVEIEPKPHAFFLVLLSAATQDATLREQWLTDARNKMDQQLQLHFPDLEMIAGALPYSKYSWPLKWLMRRIARQSGGGTNIFQDYEYTDWSQVERYAHKLMQMG